MRSQRIVSVSYNKKWMRVVMPKHNIIDKAIICPLGVVKGVWHRRIKKQVIVELELHSWKKSKFIMVDLIEFPCIFNDYYYSTEETIRYLMLKLP